MTIRPVDDNDDMMPVYTLDDMATGAKAVSQIIRDNLTLIQGEWWEDPSLGLDVPGFILDNARSQDVSLLEQYISKYILSVEGVESLINVEVEFSGHQMTYKCTVLAEGESEDVEVDLNGLLGA